MPREPRIYIENVLYLITAKGDEDRDLFNDHEDYETFITLLRNYKREYGFKLYAFTLLPKSLCLLIELRHNVKISTIMHNLNSKYTKAYNSRYGKRGHLFQSRFKSKLIEKDEYLLRLTRNIHLFPQEQGAAPALSDYSYSSYPLYINAESPKNIVSKMPDISSEMDEVLAFFPEVSPLDNKRKGYEEFVLSAGTRELEDMQKLLHRRTFVGSAAFVNQMQQQVEQHIREEEKARVIRKVNPGYVLAGSLVILFLGIAAYNFYHTQTALQTALRKTTSGFGVFSNEMTERVHSLESEITSYEEKANYGLGGPAWELRFTPVEQEKTNESYTDRLHFKDGQVISAELKARGFSPFEYTISEQTHGKKIWQTVQTGADGTTVRWYGIIAGGKMRGVFSEIPAQGQSRDFSFVSVRRVNNG